MEPSDLVALAMKQQRVSTYADLGRKLWPGDTNAPKRIERWLSGPNKPKYEQTLRLLEGANLLRDRPVRTRGGRASDAEMERAFLHVEAALAEVRAIAGLAPSPQAPQQADEGG